MGETKKKVMTRITEHQQDSIKGKWESSGATKHCLKCHGQFMVNLTSYLLWNGFFDSVVHFQDR